LSCSQINGAFGVHPGKLLGYSLTLFMWVLLPWIGLIIGIAMSVQPSPSLIWNVVALFAFISVASALGMTGVFALLARSSPLYAFSVPLGVMVLLVIGWSNALDVLLRVGPPVEGPYRGE